MPNECEYLDINCPRMMGGEIPGHGICNCCLLSLLINKLGFGNLKIKQSENDKEFSSINDAIDHAIDKNRTGGII